MHVADGRMGYIGMVRAEAPFIIGRPSTGLRDRAGENGSNCLLR